MENRKQKHVTDIIKHVEDNYWKLTLQEFDVLESILDIFQASDKREIDKIEHLVNDETEKLLSLLSSYEIQNYATEEFNLVSATDEGDLVNALEELGYNWTYKMDIDSAIEYVEDEGYTVTNDDEIDRGFDYVDNHLFFDIEETFQNLNVFDRQRLRDYVFNFK